jgi:arylsulfatase A
MNNNPNRRTFLRSLGAAGLTLAGQRLTGATTPPNIVLIVGDDLGYGDLSSYGCPDINTPNIDSIGRAGIRFTQFYANGPECTPTRCALMTGRYQQRVGGMECAIGIGDVGRYDEAIWLQQRGELGLPRSETTIASMLKGAGYQTACIGKWHLGYAEKFRPTQHGFDYYFGLLGGSIDYFRHVEPDLKPMLFEGDKPVQQSGYMTDLLADQAIHWLKTPKTKPYFLYLPFNAPHAPFEGPGDREKKPTAQTWNQGDRATYTRMVESLDNNVGRVLKQLERMPDVSNTVVLFISDNGGHQLARNEPLRGKKGSVWEGGIRVPCVIRWPGKIQPGINTPQAAITMDLAPTFLEMAGGAPPSGRKLDGVSLVPTLTGNRPVFERTLFWRYKRDQAVLKAVRQGTMKFVVSQAGISLYNLEQDLQERTDIRSEHPQLAKELQSKLSNWEHEVEAPRLRDFPRKAASLRFKTFIGSATTEEL